MKVSEKIKYLLGQGIEMPKTKTNLSPLIHRALGKFVVKFQDLEDAVLANIKVRNGKQTDGKFNMKYDFSFSLVIKELRKILSEKGDNTPYVEKLVIQTEQANQIRNLLVHSNYSGPSNINRAVLFKRPNKNASENTSDVIELGSDDIDAYTEWVELLYQAWINAYQSYTEYKSLKNQSHP